MDTFEYYYKDVKNNVETDYIIYYESGEIKSWSLWSEALNDWIELPLESIRKLWPGKVEDIELKLADHIASEKNFRL